MYFRHKHAKHGDKKTKQNKKKLENITSEDAPPCGATNFTVSYTILLDQIGSILR